MVISLTPYCCMLSGGAANANSFVSGSKRAGLEPTIYRTQGEHTNHYVIRAVDNSFEIS